MKVNSVFFWRKVTMNNKQVNVLTTPQKRRAYHAVVEVDGFIYVIGGFDGHTIYNSCDRYNLKSGKWLSMCGMMKRLASFHRTLSEPGSPQRFRL